MRVFITSLFSRFYGQHGTYMQNVCEKQTKLVGGRNRERFVMGHKLELLRLSEVKVENSLITALKDSRGWRGENRKIYEFLSFPKHAYTYALVNNQNFNPLSIKLNFH